MISRGRRVSGMPATKNSFSRWQVIQMKCHSSHRLAVSAATNVHYPYLNLKEQIQSEFLPLATLVRTSLSLAKTSSQASKLRQYQNSDPPSDWLTGVKGRATGVAKNCHASRNWPGISFPRSHFIGQTLLSPRIRPACITAIACVPASWESHLRDTIVSKDLEQVDL